MRFMFQGEIDGTSKALVAVALCLVALLLAVTIVRMEYEAAPRAPEPVSLYEAHGAVAHRAVLPPPWPAVTLTGERRVAAR
jgi:hypothetical protein